VTPSGHAPRFPRRHAAPSAAAHRLPGGIGRASLFALLATVIVLAAVECWCRARGISPEVQDDQRLWASVRDGMHPDDPAQIALVGTSRLRQDIDVRTFSQGMGGDPVAQLAIEGDDGVLIFDSLSRDVHFRGLVIFDVAPWTFFSNVTKPDETSIEYLAYDAHKPWIDPIEQRLCTATQLSLAFRRLSYDAALGAIREHKLPGPTGFMVDPDRGRRVDWSLVPQRIIDEPVHRLMPPGTGASAQRLRENLNGLEATIRRIESRGGRVVLLSLPSTGAVGAAERAALPRERYWDVLAATTSAVTLNWMDDPRLGRFQCPDGSHLDMRDQAEFTRIVVEDLREKMQTRYATAAGCR
jgi:hypothetical protein